MNYDAERVDEAVLALLYLTLHDPGEHGGRAWKTHDWEAMNRLYEKGLIGNPVSKAKSVVVTAKGAAEGERLFAKLFGAGTTSS